MTQSETVSFLASGDAFPGGGPVEVIETHGARVFLCGDTALKLKRAVKYDYLDMSTVARRKAMIARELELNRASAPQIYRDMLPVTRGAGGLSLGGAGEVIDWVLRMWRFPAESELPRIVARGGLDDRLASGVGEAVAAYHARAPVVRRGGRGLIADILAELGRVFAEFPGAEGTARVATWREAAETALAQVGPLLDARGEQGHVRRAHGDLHLHNIVVLEGRPVLFDALEFDETLGTCDVLYDIAFLVMDLCHAGLCRQACRVLDAWLRASRGREDAGLAALPLFLSVRAAIRAMVLLQTDAAQGLPGRSGAEVAAYLDLAYAALRPAGPRLFAIGGYSGHGQKRPCPRPCPGNRGPSRRGPAEFGPGEKGGSAGRCAAWPGGLLGRTARGGLPGDVRPRGDDPHGGTLGGAGRHLPRPGAAGRGRRGGAGSRAALPRALARCAARAAGGPCAGQAGGCL